MKAGLSRRHRPDAYRLEFVLFTLLLLVSLLLLFYSPRFTSSPAVAQLLGGQARAERALPPLPREANLFFTAADTLALAAAEIARNSDGAPMTAGPPHTLLGELRAVPKGDETGRGGPSIVSGIYPSPDRSLVAVEYDLGSRPQVQLLNLADRSAPKLTALTPTGWLRFLAWHPDGHSLLVQTADLEVTDPGLWVVNAAEGTHTRIETPGLFVTEGVIAAAFSPDGKDVIYSVSNGLGFGSEVWRVNLDSKEQRLLFKDEYTIVGSLSWSPDGSQIAFTKLLDSPVAFAEAGLWVMDGAGEQARALALMDGGHGQKPIWSHDGRELYYVARENLDDSAADYDAERLVSSIRAVSAQGGEYRILVPADGARQIDVSLTAGGDMLFASNRAGTLDVWSVDRNGALVQLTSDEAAQRHPVLVESGF